MGLLRELADRTGLSTQVTAALADTYRGRWAYAPGEVVADLAGAGPATRGPRHTIRLPRAPTARTAWTGSDNSAATASTPSARRPRRPRCGGWSTNVSTPRVCPQYVAPEPVPGQRRGPREPPPSPGTGCISTSTPPW